MPQGKIKVSAPMDRTFDGKRYRLEDIYPTKKRALGMKRMLRADGYSIRVIHYPGHTYPYAVYKRRVRAF
jgi:hypothetical protein